MAFSLGRRLVRPVVRRCRTAADAAIGLSLRLVDADSDSQVVTGSANRNVVPCVGAARRGASRGCGGNRKSLGWAKPWRALEHAVGVDELPLASASLDSSECWS